MSERLDTTNKNLGALSRREFLGYSAGLAAGALLSSCGIKPETYRPPETSSPSAVGNTETTYPPEYNSPKYDVPEYYDPASTAWTYDFGALPNGPLPTKDWNFEKGTKVADYNNEAQVYTDRLQNVRVENGSLVIEAHKEKYADRDFTSARINTLKKFSFTYGTLEADVMLPRGSGTWPAIWLLSRYNIYNADDFGIAKNDNLRWAMNGEIDFLEAIGRIPKHNIPTTHSYNSRQKQGIWTPAEVEDAYTQYHRYGIIKTPDQITFTLDGQPYATRKKTSDDPMDWPFNQPYYLIVNLTIGGGWAVDTKNFPSNGIDESKSPWQLKVRSLNYTPL